MESVYKLSKYSQKIGEACRAKQLDKVIEYNKHELAYINKLSKYFNNQKGGANVDEVFDVLKEAIDNIKKEAQQAQQAQQAELAKTQQELEQAKEETSRAQQELLEVQKALAESAQNIQQQVQRIKSKGGSKRKN
jgi:uncharacterized protein (UPF0305 family)